MGIIARLNMLKADFEKIEGWQRELKEIKVPNKGEVSPDGLKRRQKSLDDLSAKEVKSDHPFIRVSVVALRADCQRKKADLEALLPGIFDRIWEGRRPKPQPPVQVLTAKASSLN